MRIKVEFIIEKTPAYFPLNNHPWVSLIYNALREANSDYADFLHNYGYRLDSEQHSSKANKKRKPFVFSRPEISNSRIINNNLCAFGQVVKWQISSPIEQLIDILVIGLKKQAVFSVFDEKTQQAYKNKEIDSYKAKLILSKIEYVQAPAFTNKMRFIALSPINVSVDSTNREGKSFLRPDDKQFSTIIRNDLIEKYELLNGKVPENKELLFELDWDYICQKYKLEFLENVLDINKKLEIKKICTDKVSKLVQYEQTNIKAYLAPFIVAGNPELIRVGWDWGFGNSNSQGFGMAQFSSERY